MAGTPKSVKKLRSGDLLVETASAKHSELLLRATALGKYPCSVTPHTYLNSSRGVISERDLIDCSEDEILNELREQGVVSVRHIKFRRDGNFVNSRNLVLTFNTPNLPKNIKAGYLNCPVRAYIPNPLRCFKCQAFGHSQTSCRNNPTCSNCGQPAHDTPDCPNAASCVNCKQAHAAASRVCPKWKEEQAIQKVKVLDGLSYQEARKKVVAPVPARGLYATAARPTSSVGTQTAISVPPSESFAEYAKSMLSSASTKNACTLTPVSVQPTTSNGAPHPPQRSSSPASGKSSKSKPGPKHTKAKHKSHACPDEDMQVSDYDTS